ncbi:MAG TPA: BatD family protein [Rhodanobacteraceae bacterium]
MMRRWCVVLLVLLAPLAQAATLHAFLDRTHVSLGDTVTLNIQSSGSIGTPDLSPLQKDFRVLGTSRSSSMQVTNGQSTQTSQIGIALKPLHAGSLTIPALNVGGVKTQPLMLEVGAAPAGGTGKLGDPVFMEASVSSSSPYVNQQVDYTVRLFYLPGVNGALGDPDVSGARLVKLDRDHRYVVNRDGYAYKVIERTWALIPQKTGTITVDGPEFQGQRLASGNPGAWFNNPNALLNNPNALLNGQMPGFGATVDATAPAVSINARAAPANGGKPWLPARDVQLKLTGVPANGEVNAGTPLTLTLSISASGQPADALPEPELPPIAGAHVYPDQTQDSTDDTGQWLQGTRTRSFAIVPDRNGKLSLPTITMAWWDVVHDRAETATTKPAVLHVSGVMAGAAAVAPSAPAAPSSAVQTTTPPRSVAASMPAVKVPGNPSFLWQWVALASLALWVLAIIAVAVWWWLRKRGMPPRGFGNDAQAKRGVEPIPAKLDARALQRQVIDAAQAGDAAACEHALLTWARADRHGVSSLTALRDALSDPAQRDALDALQRTRWRGGDAAAACAAVASAFAHGFVWRSQGTTTHDHESDLPPLYPS